MIEFYLWPRSVCYVITFAIVLCVLAQILTVMVSFYRYPRSRSRIFEAVLELFILGYVVVCSLLHGQAMMGYQIGLFAPGGYDGLRTFFFAAVSLCAILAFAGTRKPQTLIVLVFAGLTLPVTEQLTDHLFAYLYVAAILFWLSRGVLTGLPRYREIKENLSALSVKNAMDSLHTGVMFCEPGGFIVLCNKQMQQLMTVTTGKIQRNGEQFFMLLASKEIDPACEIAWFEGQYTCLLPDGSAWIFARTDLKIKRKTYRQITATDITERWKLTEALRAQNKELTRRKDGLIRTLNNLQALSRERETQRARMRAHDILGERLTLLLRMVRGEPAPDYDLLRSLTARLMDELKEAESVHAPQDDMEILKQTFASIGVEVLSCGTLPQDPEKGKLLVDISKEAVTNAVRHGFATKVYITMRTGEGRHHMQITDNGGLSAGTMNDEPPADTMTGGMSAWTMNDRLSDNTMSGESPADTIKEGGGISGMRNRLAALGGTLRVTARPGFTLTIDLPEDEKDAEDAYR